MACSDTYWQTPLPGPNHPLRQWLAARGSLTARLRSRATTFRVASLSQQLGRPDHDEAALIGLSAGRLALVREVVLHCDERPTVFAHSIVAADDVRHPWRFVASLGNRPLGAVLFSDPRIERAPLHFKTLDRRHPLYRHAAAHLPSVPARLWARRSLFRLDGSPLLVTEVFLPTVMELGK